MSEVVNGQAKIEEIRDIEIEDLLGRDSVSPDIDLLGACINGKCVLVTGAGGSIGSELCRQIIKQKPRRLVLFELSEFGLYSIERELKHLIEKSGQDIELIALLGSVQHKVRMRIVMTTFGVQTVYHAAAYKHVPLVEHNIIEGVRNNVFGTWHTAEAAIEAGVERFVLISTDKAVRPTNVMGATKRMAELVLQGLSKRQTSTRFCMVRFGNVLGSSGSVVPLFREQIRKGGPITVTHPDIIRYFMTIPEAAQLVIQAGSMGVGGDVFVLDMGEQVKIVDLAHKMIRLMGYEVRDQKNPQGDIEVVFTGLRPGEKLYEELLVGECSEGTAHRRIMKAHEIDLPWEELSILLERLDHGCHAFDCHAIIDMLRSAPLSFTPKDGVNDLVCMRNRVAARDKKVVPITEVSVR
jgi:FlaA1/EpsC-like NDP-sugar epimerase